MANDAIAFDVAARAHAHRAARFGSVSPRPSNPVGSGRMKTSPDGGCGSGDRREPETRMAFDTKSLRRVTARALRLIAARHVGVMGQEVVLMNASRLSTRIVASNAFALLMTLGAKSSAVGGYPTMPNEEVAIVVHPIQPLGRKKQLLAMPCAHAPIGFRQMASRALSLCALRLSTDAIAAVATKARTHRWQMRARGERGLLDTLMTVQTPHAFASVGLVVKMDARRGKRTGRDLRAIGADVAIAATLDVCVRAIRLFGVTRVARLLAGHEEIAGPSTAERILVAARATQTPVRGMGVIHSKCDALRRIHDVRAQSGARGLADNLGGHQMVQQPDGDDCKERNECTSHRHARIVSPAVPRKRCPTMRLWLHSSSNRKRVRAVSRAIAPTATEVAAP